MPYDVFICHSSRDRQIADEVCSVFESNRLRCWIAPRDITTGATWAGSIRAAIDECQVLLVCLSANANDSEDVHREIDMARRVGTDIACLRIEDVQPNGDLGYYLNILQHYDAFTPPRAPSLDSLVKELQKKIHRVPSPEELLERTLSEVSALADSNETVRTQSAQALSGPFDIACKLLPCEEVGGDFLDIITLRDGFAALVIGDVSGHGFSSGLRVVEFRAYLRAFLSCADPGSKSSVTKVMSQLNEELLRDLPDFMFMTAFLALLNVDLRKLSWCGAGCDNPVLRRSDGSIERLARNGMALSLDDSAEYLVHEPIELQPGDTLLAFTDGLAEIRREPNDLYGEERIISSLQHHAKGTASSEQIMAGLLEDADAFRGEDPLQDDLTVLVLRCQASTDGRDD